MSLTAAPSPTQARDPFNWPSLQRNDLMSATGGLTSQKDLFNMVKENLRPKKREASSNLDNGDILGTLHEYCFLSPPLL